jgi:hypothetical protein
VRRVVAALALAASAATAGYAAGYVARDEAPRPAAPKSSAALTACAVEDSPGPCYWDAAHRGNHRGVSFVRLADGRTVRLRTTWQPGIWQQPYGGCDEAWHYRFRHDPGFRQCARHGYYVGRVPAKWPVHGPR